ncbi:FAD-binding oxidoreductase [Aminipila butyrica]|uniref:FAD-binding oxidoreductase n=1 Tax=Aminipila butyrica TaxID=433296 RepID=A0A858BXW6_9FIRM|nr:FAD-binding oxidoreductase [Aminipila butyrica]QIB68906.1 FAD-binding oxidoreductase [Aminipila butyrica]
MKDADVKNLTDIVGADWIITDLEQKSAYFYDEIERALRPVANEQSIVVKPKNTEELSAIMAYAYEQEIPVVIRGGGTGLCGGATPVVESLILSMERFKKIIQIDEDNMMAELEAGVTLRELLDELEGHKGIAFPVHPGDEGAQIGGMVTTNAGGARAVRHGIMRNHIKGLEVVLPDGEVLKLGGRLLKDNAGYSLMNLLTGSEGTLAAITKVILRLYPEDKYSATLAIAFADMDQASAAVLEIIKSGVSPLAVEYQDKKLNLETAAYLGLHWPLDEGEADLMIILSERSEAALYLACEQIEAICRKHQAVKAVYAGTKKEQAELLMIRSGSYEIIQELIAHNLDMAVPPARVPEFMRGLRKLAEKYGTRTNIVAHIADGNVHNDILLEDGKIPAFTPDLLKEMYELCFQLGGTITGEHGVGKLRLADLKLQKNNRELELMKQIKKIFDPKGILNPGTVVQIDGCNKN